jgi:hypothetical protein
VATALCTVCNAALRATDNVTQWRGYTFITRSFSKEQRKKDLDIPWVPQSQSARRLQVSIL